MKLTLFNIRRYILHLKECIDILIWNNNDMVDKLKEYEKRIKQLEADVRFLQNKF